MPYNASELTLSGISCRHPVHSTSLLGAQCESVFVASIAGKQFFIQSADLSDMGYRVVVYSACHAQLFDDRGRRHAVYCPPAAVDVLPSPSTGAVKLEPGVISSVSLADTSQKS